MFFSKKSKAQFLIGMSVDENAAERSEGFLKTISLAFALGAGPPDYKDRNESVTMLIFRESQESVTHAMGGADVFSMTTEALEVMIDIFEKDGKGLIKDVAGPGEVFALALGGTKFCQAFVHFMTTGRGGVAQNWGLHFIRRLSDAKNGQIYWYDSRKPTQFSWGSTKAMLEHYETFPADT